MRLLFELDKKNYENCTHIFRRDSARSIIIRSGKIAMIKSEKNGFYKFPGGGIEGGESPVEAMIRETREEAGLLVKPETVREYGLVHRIQRGSRDETECFIQDNYYYLCEAEDTAVPQTLTVNETEERFVPVFTDPETVIEANRRMAERARDPAMFERERRVIEQLIAEGLL